MPVLVVLIVVSLLLVIQRAVYRKYWSKKLTAQVKFKDHYLFEGSDTELTEVLINDKLLPLPWVHLKFQIIRNGKTDNLFRSDLFNILFHQQITRNSRIKLDRRGVYQISQLDLLSYDLFISKKFVQVLDNRTEITVYPRTVERESFDVPYEKIMGTLATKRYTMEDPFLFKGIRDYQPHDSFKSINFKASAKSGKWLVNTNEYTVNQTVHILLLTDRGTDYYEENVYEAGLRLAAAMASRFEEDGVPVSFYSNGLDSLDGQEPNLGSGCSESHLDSILESLARLELRETGTSGTDLIAGLQERHEAEDYYVIISAYFGKDLLMEYEALREFTSSCCWLAPVSHKDFLSLEQRIQELEQTEEDFFFYQV